MKEYESFERVGVEPHRSYYVPFAEQDVVKTKYGIVDRTSSSRFLSLDGVWGIQAHTSPEQVVIDEDVFEKIPVPACVQMHGYDHIQYLNVRYPFPVDFPRVPKENPCWHYRRKFTLLKSEREKYYLNFEGVDSAFYLYVNGKYKGYSQISHATSEFDITDLVQDGENTIDVLVLKWCVSTYLECQDKFRFSGIFRSVYLLKRPKNHLRDFRILTEFEGKDGILSFKNESTVGASLSFCGKTAFVQAKKQVEFRVANVEKWTPETPRLYTLTIVANGEKIVEKVGFRTVDIRGKVFCVNGEAVKLKGVNRHDFNCKTAATVTLKNLVQDVKLMKRLNVNAVRTSHYPNMPEFAQICDRYGIYMMEEADLETHGACTCCGNAPNLWDSFAEDERFSAGIYSRHVALVERDKNRPCVIIWSLGNESSFGKAFLKGVKYIRRRDKTRPIHYESLQWANRKYYYTPLVDMVSMMYPPLEKIKTDVLENSEENRPSVMCEYTHAMGNSSGDIADYWKLIYANEQCMGAFVWEWADHAIKTKKGFLYGGDFGEKEHDGNFCCDGLLTADRKIKSAALEMQAVYAGKTERAKPEAEIPKVKQSGKKVEISVNEKTGALTSLKVAGEEILCSPVKLNWLRYTDNDRERYPVWKNEWRLEDAYALADTTQKTENGYLFNGCVSANCLCPAVRFSLGYEVEGSALKVRVAYEIADYVKHLPRFGLELEIPGRYNEFSFVGYGPGESYIDKNVRCEYGYFESDAEKNYDENYVRPQESGSHYYSRYLALKGLCAVTAEKPFSFSVNPYATKELIAARHGFELKKGESVFVCLDLAMSGVGSNSCGPQLRAEYEIPRKGENVFTLVF